MPKGRMLSKKISYDEKVANLSVPAALLYTWCIPHLDVEGRIYGEPEILKGTVVPYIKQITLAIIPKLQQELVDTGLVVIYGNSHKYMQFKGFQNNQTINKDREAPSEIPAPTKLLINSCVTPAKVNISKVNISKDKRKGLTAPLSDLDFIKALKDNPIYKHVNIDIELGKMDVWLSTRLGRQKTRRFIVNWLNKIDRPIRTSKPATHKLYKPPVVEGPVFEGTKKSLLSKAGQSDL